MASAAEKLPDASHPLRNAKHEAVLQAFISDPNRLGSKAYLVVYPQSSERAAQVAFGRLMRNAAFEGRLKFLESAVTAVAVKESGVTIAETVAELAKIGFANMGNYVSIEAGVPRLDFKQLDEAKLAAISEITSEEEILAGDEESKSVRVRKTKFKLHNKQAALVSILDHLGGFSARKLADPDGRPLGTGAAETIAGKFSDLEVARRLAFALERGARAPKAKKTKR